MVNVARSNGVRLLCLDVDGTLLGASGEVSANVWRALARARDAGIRLALCSGRPGFGVTRSLASQLTPNGWHCFQNGASILHLGSGESRSAAIPPEVIALLVSRARRESRVFELYTDDDYVSESTAEVARAHAAILGLTFAPRAYETLSPPIVRAQWIVEHHELEAVISQPHPGLEISPSLGPALPNHVFVNLTREGVDKGSAVRTVAQAYGVSLDQVMYVGDGFNDTPALRIVGVPVVMRNAEAAALALGKHVVGTVEEDGVVQAVALALAMSDA